LFTARALARPARAALPRENHGELAAPLVSTLLGPAALTEMLPDRLFLSSISFVRSISESMTFLESELLVDEAADADKMPASSQQPVSTD
jgi:hypothetical protein